MLNNFISDKDFKDTGTIYAASKPVEIFMVSDINENIDTLFNTILERIENSILYYYLQKIEIRRGESYVISSHWLVSKKATINPKNEKDNKCFQWAIISGLNHNKIKEKKWKNY